MASCAYRSENGVASLLVNDSIACANTSNPVAAVIFFGSVAISSESTIATFGNITSAPAPGFSLVFVFVITEYGVIWLPVPDVVVTAIIGNAA